MNLLPQTLMGATVAEVFGFSFSALRGLTQVIALATSLLAYAFFLACGLSLRSALLGAVALVCLPWWQVLANTYMSDIYGLMFALLSAYALIRYLNTERTRFLILGSLFAAVGTLERQVVLVIPVGFACAQIFLHGFRSWRNMIIATMPALVAMGAEFVYQTWLAAGTGIPLAQRAIHCRASHFVMLLLNLDVHRWTKFAQKSLEMTGYLGLFLVGPLAAYFLSHEEKRANIARIVLAAFVVFVICLSFNWLPPYRINNLITVTGIGPYTLLDGMVDDSSTPHSKGFFWQAAGALASLGMVLLLYALMKMRTAFHRLSRTASAALVMFSAITLCYLLPFAITDYFDRYLLFVCPFLYAAIVLILNHVTETPIRAWGYALSCFMLMGLLSAAVVHDYFSWNRARWAMIHHAETELGANSFDLDGGFEYNGFHNFESRKKVGGDQGKSWWWVVDDMYRVSFGLMPGYSSIRHIVVDAYLPTTPERVHLLKRNE